MMQRRSDRPTATPCVDCGTRLGTPTSAINPIPHRTRGLCDNCYRHHYNRNTLAKFPKLRHDTVTARAIGVKLRHPAERREEQRQRIAERVARHDHGYDPLNVVIEGDDFDHLLRRRNAEDTALVWQAQHPHHQAEWDHPEHETFGAANAAPRAA